MIKSLFIFLCCLTVLFNNNIKDIKAEENETYNLFTAKEWSLSPYVFGGYSFIHAPIEHSISPKKDINGWTLGTGLTINKQWSFGLSIQHYIKTTSVGNDLYINGLKTETFFINLDANLHLPFDFFEKKLNFFVVCGLNLIVMNLDNMYKDIDVVPLSYLKDMHNIAFGGNIGLSVKYTLFGGLSLGLETKRLFIFTTKSSKIKDSWIVNAVVGLNF